MHDKQIERGDRRTAFDHDLARIEPILALTSVQHQLQAADGDAQKCEALEVHRLGASRFRFGQRGAQRQERGNPDRHVDIEHPSPAVVLGQPAAEGGAQNRADHHAHAPGRHCRTLLLARVAVEQSGLRQRHQRGTEYALQQTEQDDLAEVSGDAAQHRGDREARDRDQEDSLHAEAIGEIARGCGRNRRSDDVRGQHPGDLILGRRQAALHVRQRDVGDRGVERLHHRGGQGPEGHQQA